MATSWTFNPFTGNLDAVGGSTNEFSDSLFRIYDNGDSTKKLAVEVSAIGTGVTRTITVGNENINISTGSSGSFANATLSNLDSPTAVNEDLLPSGTKNLGSAAAVWNETYSDNVISNTNLILRSRNTGGTDSPTATLKSGDSSTGDSGAVVVRSGSSTGSTSGTWSAGSGNAAVSAGVTLSSGTGAISSGSVTLSPGASVTRGKIKFVDGSEGTASQLWTSSATDGSGAWAAPSFSDSVFRITDNGDVTKKLAFEVSAITTGTTRTITMPDSNINLATTGSGSFANVNLSNLGTTSINSDLLPSADNTRSIGSSTLTWTEAFIDTITAASPLMLRSIDASGVASGTATLKSGNTTSGNSGLVTVRSGTTATSGTSGAWSGGTGNSVASSGDVTLSSGNGVTSGNVDISAGTASGGGSSRGSMNLSAKTINLITTGPGGNVQPGTDNTDEFGSQDLRWSQVYAFGNILYGGVTLRNTDHTTKFSLSTNMVSPTGVTVAGISGADQSRQYAFFTNDNATNNSTTTPALYFETGNKTHASATAGSGGIFQQTGTAAAGATSPTGSFLFKTGNNAGTDTGAHSGSLALQAGTVVGGTRGSITLDALSVNSTSRIAVPTADAGSPQYTFTADLDTGVANTAANVLRLVTAGTTRLLVDTTKITFSLQAQALDGTAATPGYTFSGDTATGLFGVSTSVLGVSVAGTSRMEFATAEMRPSTNLGYTLGSSAKYFSGVIAQSFNPKNNGAITFLTSGDVAQMTVNVSTDTPSGINAHNIRSREVGKAMAVYTENNATNNSVATDDVLIETGNKTHASATGNSGNIKLTPGTVTLGTRGTVQVFGSGLVLSNIAADPAGAVAGQVYYNTVLNKIKMYNGTTWETVTSI